MAHNPLTSKTFQVDNAVATPVPAGTILAYSTVNPGNAMISGAKQKGFCGITKEGTDKKGYVAAAYYGEVDVIVGGAVNAGDSVASDANGHAVTVVPANAGATTQIIGIAQVSQPVVGQMVKVLLQPQTCLS